jgi:hypothetical protein
MSNESTRRRSKSRRGAADERSGGEAVPPAPNVTRRVFLRNGSLTVAAAGLLSAAPGLPALFSELAPDAPAADTAAADMPELATGALSESLVVQVKDLQTGEMSLYLGEREIVYRDPGLASKILRSAR